MRWYCGGNAEADWQKLTRQLMAGILWYIWWLERPAPHILFFSQRVLFHVLSSSVGLSSGPGEGASFAFRLFACSAAGGKEYYVVTNNEQNHDDILLALQLLYFVHDVGDERPVYNTWPIKINIGVPVLVRCNFLWWMLTAALCFHCWSQSIGVSIYIYCITENVLNLVT